MVPRSSRGRIQQRLEQGVQRPGHVRVAAQQHRVREDPVVQEVEEPGVDARPGSPALAQHRRVHVRDADAARTDPGRAQRLRGEPVPEQLVVRGDERVVHPGLAGGVDAEGVAVERDGRRFVDGHPPLDPVAERLPRRARVLREPQGGVAGPPAAGLLQRLGGVPVEQRRHRADAATRAGRRSGGRSSATAFAVERAACRRAWRRGQPNENRYASAPSSLQQRDILRPRDGTGRW